MGFLASWVTPRLNVGGSFFRSMSQTDIFLTGTEITSPGLYPLTYMDGTYKGSSMGIPSDPIVNEDPSPQSM